MTRKEASAWVASRYTDYQPNCKAIWCINRPGIVEVEALISDTITPHNWRLEYAADGNIPLSVPAWREVGR